MTNLLPQMVVELVAEQFNVRFVRALFNEVSSLVTLA